jgi:predicted AAA+ superfamily ATPase
MIPRTRAYEHINKVLGLYPISALLGPRQCGKTTLARQIAEQLAPSVFFDLENPIDSRRLSAPMSILEKLTGLVIIDEIQRRPDLFELLRVLADRTDKPARFLLLGSASPDLVKGASESLAGRIGFIDLSGFNLWETGIENRDLLWMRGGFPRSFLSPDDNASILWREDFIRTFLERDIPQLGINIPSETLRRFWTMVAHYHGRIWNAAQFARSLGTSEATARRYLDILAGAYMIRVLPPWFENIRKRQVKAPKIYIRDSGIFHALLGIQTLSDLQGHPMLGASWENFALEHILGIFKGHDVYFWATHAGAEMDLLVITKGKRYGFEFKYTDAPGSSRSMRTAIQDLALEHLWVIYPGNQEYEIDSKISVIPVQHISGLPILID